MFLAPPPPPPQIPKPVTIWVHGTRPSAVLPFLSTNDKIQKRIDNSIPKKKGLRPFFDLKPQGKTHALLQALSAASPDQFPIETIYSFGWSGDLSVTARKQAAEQLWATIKLLVESLKLQYGTAPPITLITHSHGGNVALHMSHVRDDSSIQFARTILLACPVQKETSEYAQHPLFGTVYSIHSHVDMVQILDPQRLQPYKNAFAAWQESKDFEHLKQAYLLGLAHPLFSERHFPHTPNIIQADVSWKSGFGMPINHNLPPSSKIESFFHSLANRIINQPRGVLHTEFITATFMERLPEILSELDAYHKNQPTISKDVQILI